MEQQVPLRQPWGYKRQDEKKTFLAERAEKHWKRRPGEVFKARWDTLPEGGEGELLCQGQGWISCLMCCSDFPHHAPAPSPPASPPSHPLRISHPSPLSTHPCHLLPQHLSPSISPFLLPPSHTACPAQPSPSHTHLAGHVQPLSLFAGAASLTYCVFIRKSCKPRKHLNDEVLMQCLLTSAMHQPLGTSKGWGFFS